MYLKALIILGLMLVSTTSYAQPITGEWNASTDFGNFSFIVNSSGTHITNITYNFSDWRCGSVTKNGTISTGKDPGWPISEGQFTIENSIGLPFENHTMTIDGTFNEAGNRASGTWNAVISGNTCQGNWTSTPVGVEECERGDVNCDMTLTPGDALCAFWRSILGSFQEECECECSELAADINCDGAITPGDALCIFWRSILGEWQEECQCSP